MTGIPPRSRLAVTGGGDEGRAPSRRRTFHLWHGSIAVLVSALVFGLFRALGAETPQSMLFSLLALALAIAYVASVSFASKIGSRMTRSLKEWGLDRGGIVGFCAWLFALLVNVMIIVGAIFLGPALVIGLGTWLIRTAGL